ncbi:MAG: glutamate ligase domain-containing protein, partial [Tepidisphaeraceae bacterium]
RLQIHPIDGITLLNDAYNANPNSMRAALETVAQLTTEGRRVAVLGDMLELGESAARYHREIGELASKCKLDLLACVGEQAALIARTAQDASMPARSIHCFDDSAEAARQIPRWLRRGDLVLLKASRGIHLETVAQAIADQAPRFGRRVKVAS